MNINNPPKAFLLLVAMLCLTGLLAINRIDPVVGMGLFGSIVGYGIGNGVAAKSGDSVEPVFGSTRRDRRAGDREEGDDE